MKFEKITNQGEFPLRNYHFLIHEGENFIEGHGVLENPDPSQYSDSAWERELSHIEDALWDRYGSLCRGEDGKLYGVEYAMIIDYSTNEMAFVPAAWARVEPNTEDDD